MKHFYSFPFFLMGFITLNAQITLTSATSTPSAGDSFDYVIIPNYNLNVSHDGANMTWDFSSASGNTQTSDFIDISNSSEPSNFPSANLVGVIPTAETYFFTSSSEFSIEGNYAPGFGRDIYTNKREFLKFPITYSDNFNETFEGTVENTSNQIFTRSGTISITADGYGNLILPYATVNNVLKIKVITTYNDVYMGNIVGTYEETILVWYDLLNKGHIASTTDAIANGFPAASQATYIAQSDLVLGTNDHNRFESQITVYPNPSEEYTTLNNKTRDNLNIVIYDTKGVLIKNIDLDIGETNIDTSSLQSGMYLIKAISNTGTSTQKLLVK